MEEVFGFSVLVLTVVGLAGIAVWFCCSMAESVIKTRRRIQHSRYDALSKENERLKGFLVEVEEENFRLREIYRSERTHHKRNAERNVA